MRTPTRIGTVESVTGASVTASLTPDVLTGLSYVEGEAYRVGQVGSFVRIPRGNTDLYGIVTQAGVASAPASEIGADGRKWITVELVGEALPGGRLSRGVAGHPTMGDQVHLVIEEDLSIIYGARHHAQISVGHVSGSRSIPALIDVDKLVTRHSAVLGATGSGKSTTVAGLLLQLTEPARFPSARILLIDAHGEYASAFRGLAKVYRVNADPKREERPLHLPYWALSFEEFAKTALGDLREDVLGWVQEWVTARKRKAAKAGFAGGLPEEFVTADTPLPFSVHELWMDMHIQVHATYPKGAEQTPENMAFQRDAEGKIIQPGDAAAVVPPRFMPNDGAKFVLSKFPFPMTKPAEALATRLRDPRLDFLFRPGPWLPDPKGLPSEDLDSLLAAWLGGRAVDGQPEPPLSILDVSGFPSNITADLVGALLRILYDSLFWARNMSEGGRERPLLIVLEEAHSFLKTGNSPAAGAMQRIVKEGRKYGIGAMIVSQRPSEIDQTILSQCGTTFALRMGNQHDRGHVMGALSDSLRVFADLLPSLRTGEALIIGEAVGLPTRAMIRPPPVGRRPDSQDPVLVGAGTAEIPPVPGGWDRSQEPADYALVVRAWRRYDPKVT